MARSLGAESQAILDSTKKEISWLFTIVTETPNTYYFSTKTKTFTHSVYGEQTWNYAIKPNSFDGISLLRNNKELAMISPNETYFEILDPDGTYTAAEFENATVRIDLVGSECKQQLLFGTDRIAFGSDLLQFGSGSEEIFLSWKFRVKFSDKYYKTIRLTCEDFIQQYLRGTYPNTKLVKELSQSYDYVKDDNLCVPIPFGTAYIPLRSVYISDDTNRFYVLGPSDKTYTISEVHTPRDWSSIATWNTDFTFTQYTRTLDGSSYKVLDPIIADSDEDGTADATGIWKPGDYCLDPAVKFSRSDLVSVTNPADIIEWVLKDMGVPEADIDSAVSFSAASTIFDGWGLAWNGGLFTKEERSKVLARLLSMCHSCLRITDKVELHVLSKTSQKTFTDAEIKKPFGSYNEEGTFKRNYISGDSRDSAYVAYQESGKPQDRLIKILVSALSSESIGNIGSEILDCSFVQDNQNVQRLGTLHYQRLFRLNKSSVSFNTFGKFCNLEPDDVITINDSLYGGTYTAIINSFKISRELDVQIEALVPKEAILDWGDLSPDSMIIATDGTTAIWNMLISGPDGTVTNGSIPNALPGRLRIGVGVDYIILDDTDPSIKLYEGAIKRAEIGDIGGDTFGIAFYTPAGDASLIIDADNNVIKEMVYEIYTSGIIRTNADVAANGGFSVSATQMIAYTSAPLKIFQVVFSGSDWGDFYVGDYANNNAGIFYDRSVPQLYIAGDLTLETIPGYPLTNKCFLDVEFTEGYGTIVHDSSHQRATGTCYNTPQMDGYGPIGKCIFFASASNEYVGFGTNANWDVLGSGNQNMAWSFWFRVTGAPAATQYIAMKGAGNTAGWAIYITNTGKIGLGVFKSGGSSYYTSTATLSYTTWNHVTFVYTYAAADAGTIDGYIDGKFEKQVTSIATMANGSAYNLNIGATSTPSAYLDGYLQAFKLYNGYTFTANNAKSIYKYPQGARGGQLTARSVMVGTPSGSAPGIRLDDTGTWMYATAGAGLFAFAISGSTSWNSKTLEVGDFMFGSSTAYIHYDASTPAFSIVLPANSSLNISGGTHTWSGGSINITGSTVAISSTGALNISAGTHTWSGGTFNITGATISISSTGTFACSGVSFSITSGTASISTTSGLTITSASKMTIESTGGIYFGTVGRLYVSSTTMYFSTQSATQDVGIFSHDYLGLTATGIMGIAGTELRVNCNIYPNVNNTYYLGGDGGGTNYYWAGIYAYTHYWGALDEYPWDDEDDIALVRAIQSRKNKDGSLWRNKDGKLAYDVKTFPRALTNIDDLPDIISEKYKIGGVGITSQDIDEILDEEKEISLADGTIINRDEVMKHIFTNANRMSGFQLSVHRKLVEKIDLLENEIRDLKALV